MYNIFNVIWFELNWFAWYDLKRDWRGSIWFNVGGSTTKKDWRTSHGEWTTWVLGFVATIFPRLLSIKRQQLVTGDAVDAVDAVETATGRRLNHWSDQPYPKMNRSGTISHGFLVVCHSHIAPIAPWYLHFFATEAVAAHWICFHVPNVGGGHRLIHQMMVFHMWGVRFS